MRLIEFWLCLLFAPLLRCSFGRDFTGGSSHQNTTADDNRIVNDVSGGGVQANSGGSVSILTTDSGLVSLARDVASSALAGNSQAVESANQALSTGTQSAIGGVTSTARSAIDAIGSTAQNALSFAGANTSQTFGAVADVLSYDHANSVAAYGALNDLLGFARDSAASSSSAQRLATTAVADAFTTAKDSADGNRSVILIGYILVGVVAVTMFARRKAV